jgi:hypothetical protein
MPKERWDEDGSKADRRQCLVLCCDRLAVYRLPKSRAGARGYCFKHRERAVPVVVEPKLVWKWRGGWRRVPQNCQ